MNAKGIWVFAEQSHGVQNDCAFELLGKALELKNTTSEEICAILLGSQVEGLADRLIKQGADKVLLVDDVALAQYKPRTYAKALEELCLKYQPSIFLFGATTMGRDLAPRVMAKLGTGLTADVLELFVDENGVLQQVKPSYGGNIMCNIIIPEARPQMATVRPGIYEILPKNADAQGEVIKEEISVTDDADYEVLDERPIVHEGKTIEDAKFIVAVGRGIGKEENLKNVETLAEECNAQVAVTRPLVDFGWCDVQNQIGQSGKTVNPDVILNLGISGAVHYTVGIKNAKLIISVNSEKENAMFDISDYAAVADINTLLPELNRQLSERK